MKKSALSLIALTFASVSFAGPACNNVLIVNTSGASATFSTKTSLVTLENDTSGDITVCVNDTLTASSGSFTSICKFKGGGDKKTLIIAQLILGNLLCGYGSF